jgi:UbiD family decarboxylase
MKKDIYDLRSFIDRLDHEGELARVKAEVDWKYELGGVALKALRTAAKPALLFEKVKDYNSPVFTGGMLTVRRLAIALGLDPSAGEAAILAETAKRYEKPVKAVQVKTGPCKENIIMGKDVNVLKFPVPWWTEMDGGRYIGTWHQVISKDLEEDWTNVGMYRVMVHEPDLLGIQFSPFQHVAMMYAKYQKINQPMPIAIAIGNDPVCPLVAMTPFAAGINEWEMAGALRGKPLEVVKGETVDLDIPAYSEIVIEGEIPPSELRLEGPFAEHTGFYGGGKRPLPVIRVKCITHRNNPIFRGSVLGKPVTEDHRCLSLAIGSQAMLMYKNAGFPGVTAVNCPAGGDPDFCAIIAVKKEYMSHGLDAGRFLLSSKGGKILKHIIVVDHDVDVFSPDDVLWAINTRIQASRQVHITRNESGSRLDPSVPFEWLGATDKMIIDATWPMTPDFIRRPEWNNSVHAPEVKVSDELGRYIESRWAEYGIK